MVFIEEMKVGKMIGNQERESLPKPAKRRVGEGKYNSSGDETDKGETPAQLYPQHFQKS